MAIKREILADGGRPIRLVQTEPADKPEALAVARAALCIAGVGAGVVMAGGDDEADEILRPRLVPLMSRGLVHAARGARRATSTRCASHAAVSVVWPACRAVPWPTSTTRRRC